MQQLVIMFPRLCEDIGWDAAYFSKIGTQNKEMAVKNSTSWLGGCFTSSTGTLNVKCQTTMVKMIVKEEIAS